MSLPFYSDPKIVSKSPLITTFLLESANVFQLVRMWSTHTSAGQSIWGWVSVNIALWFWINYYRVLLPNEKFAKYATILGACINATVIATVVYFRYFFVH